MFGKKWQMTKDSVCIHFFLYSSFFAYRPRESVYADYVSIKVIL